MVDLGWTACGLCPGCEMQSVLKDHNAGRPAGTCHTPQLCSECEGKTARLPPRQLPGRISSRSQDGAHLRGSTCSQPWTSAPQGGWGEAGSHGAAPRLPRSLFSSFPDRCLEESRWCIRSLSEDHPFHAQGRACYVKKAALPPSVTPLPI